MSNMISHKSKTQKGGFFNKKHPAKYRNITYTKSNTGFSNPEMTCAICKHKLFKMRTLQIGTRVKDFLFNTDVFDNSFKAFTCVSCGKVEFYSKRLTFMETKLEKQKYTKKTRKSSKSKK
jgi:predicted nucleic-acid-binding Zn-ribbon protein